MKVVFSEQADADWVYWEKQDAGVLEKIRALLRDIERSPYSGIGKPEPLKYNWRGFWSRRISGEHRLVYRLHDGKIQVAQCRFHYTKK